MHVTRAFRPGVCLLIFFPIEEDLWTLIPLKGPSESACGKMKSCCICRVLADLGVLRESVKVSQSQLCWEPTIMNLNRNSLRFCYGY